MNIEARHDYPTRYEQLRLKLDLPELEEDGPAYEGQPGWWLISTDGECWAKVRATTAKDVLVEGLCPCHVEGTYVEWVPE